MSPSDSACCFDYAQYIILSIPCVYSVYNIDLHTISFVNYTTADGYNYSATEEKWGFFIYVVFPFVNNVIKSESIEDLYSFQNFIMIFSHKVFFVNFRNSILLGNNTGICKLKEVKEVDKG